MRKAWTGRPLGRDIAIGVALAAAGILLRLAVSGFVGPRTPFMTFYPAAMLAALLGGLAAGLVATAILSLTAYFWVLPQLSPYVLSGASWMALGLFLGTGVVLSVAAEAARRVRERTARAEAEAASAAERCSLSATIGRLAAIVESSDDAIVGLSTQGVITTWNEGARTLYGYDAEEAVGRHASFLCGDACTEDVTAILGHVRPGWPVRNYETRRRHKNGSVIDVSMTLSAIPDEIGDGVSGVSAVVRDITERRRMEAALRESEERFRLLLESAPDAVFVSTGGRIVYANSALARLCGVAGPDKMLGGPVLDFLDPAQRPEMAERMRALTEEDRPVEAVELRLRRRDGGLVDVEALAAPLVYGGEKGGLAFVRDITERKRMENLRADMERISRHDLKAPLNAVINLPLLLMEDGNLDPEQVTRLRMIHDAGLRMLEQIDRSLTLYRIETGAYALDPRPVDLTRLVMQVAGDLDAMTEALGVSLLVETWPRPVVANGDALLCRTMLANLIKNAVEATPRGGEVLVGLKAVAGRAVVFVRNPGTVPEEQRAHFFDKNHGSEKPGGAGLGTYSARLSAQAQHGDIGLESGDSAGTTITVRLPLWTEQETGGTGGGIADADAPLTPSAPAG